MTKTKEVNMLREKVRNLIIENTRIRQVSREKSEMERKGVQQISDMLNSILIAVAIEHGNSLRVPKDHLDLLDKYDFRAERDGDYYIFLVEEKTCEKALS